MFKRIKDILKVFKLIILVFVYSMPKIKKPKVKGPPKREEENPNQNQMYQNLLQKNEEENLKAARL